MATKDTVVETLRDWLAAASSSFVSRDDFARLEQRLEEIEELVDEIELKLTSPEASDTDPQPPQ